MKYLIAIYPSITLMCTSKFKKIFPIIFKILNIIIFIQNFAHNFHFLEILFIKFLN